MYKMYRIDIKGFERQSMIGEMIVSVLILAVAYIIYKL
jgi:hypothetical protein